MRALEFLLTCSLSFSVSISFKLAFELIQVRTGASEGQPTARGVKHEQNINALVEELAELWSKIQSAEGEAMRRRVVEMKDKMKQSRRTGLAKAELQRFEQFMPTIST